jgi:hypothetical protein
MQPTIVKDAQRLSGPEKRQRCGFHRVTGGTLPHIPAHRVIPIPRRCQRTKQLLAHATLLVSAAQMRLCAAEAQEFHCPRYSRRFESGRSAKSTGNSENAPSILASCMRSTASCTQPLPASRSGRPSLWCMYTDEKWSFASP